MLTRTRTTSGFTLIELMVAIAVLGLVLAFSVPAFQRINQSYQLKATTRNVAGTMRLWRERSMATGNEHQVQYAGSTWQVREYNTLGAEINVHAGGQFPTGVSLQNATVTPRFTRDGRVQGGASGFIVLQNQRGQRDTVSVLASGLILTQ
jgi:prepilin-type N-terminal cleavage/methylation domain-containing protein